MSVELRGFLARLLGWANHRAIDHALRTIDLATAHAAQLVLCGAGDLVPIAHALHRRIFGDERPFIVCDPRRENVPATVRSPDNFQSGVEAFKAAHGGSVCIRSSRPPRDFAKLAQRLRSTDAVQYIVCSNADSHPFLVVPGPIQLPPLAERASELPRIIDEYVLDASAALGVVARFKLRDRAWVQSWVLENKSSFSEIEKTTLRLVALRTSANISRAADRLGMAPVSLARWLERRKFAIIESSLPRGGLVAVLAGDELQGVGGRSPAGRWGDAT